MKKTVFVVTITNDKTLICDVKTVHSTKNGAIKAVEEWCEKLLNNREECKGGTVDEYGYDMCDVRDRNGNVIFQVNILERFILD